MESAEAPGWYCHSVTSGRLAIGAPRTLHHVPTQSFRQGEILLPPFYSTPGHLACQSQALDTSKSLTRPSDHLSPSSCPGCAFPLAPLRLPELSRRCLRNLMPMRAACRLRSCDEASHFARPTTPWVLDDCLAHNGRRRHHNKGSMSTVVFTTPFQV